MAVKVLKCNCKHDFQDKNYGPGNRVHNETGKTGRPSWRCTVCGRERDKEG
jgi:hypothetical protein